MTKNDKYRDQQKLEEKTIDPDYENGPVFKRKCTDWWCCPVFVAFVVGMIIISIYGFVNGDPAALAAPEDADGNKCGVTEGFEDYSLAFFANPIYYGSSNSDANFTFNKVCVKTCPFYSDALGIWLNVEDAPGSEDVFSDFSDSSSSSDWDSVFSDTLEFSDGKSYQDYIDELYSWLGLFNEEYSPYSWQEFFLTTKLECKTNSVIDTCYIDYVNLFLYDSWPFLSRYCLPNLDTEYMQSYYDEFMSDLNISDTMEQWVSDCYLTLWIIIASAAFALVIGLIYMIILQCFAKVIIYIMLIFIFAILVIAGGLCYMYSQDLEDELSDDSSWDSQETMFWLSIIFWVAAGLLFLAFLCIYHKIKVAIGVIETASEFVRKNFMILFFPLFVAISLIGWYIYWVWAAVYIYSLSSTNSDDSLTNNEKYMFYYHVFALLWINAFILAWATFVTASAACIWYFNHGHPDSKIAPIRTSLWRSIFYHMGSLAFGSFILAVIQAIRLALAYLNVFPFSPFIQCSFILNRKNSKTQD